MTTTTTIDCKYNFYAKNIIVGNTLPKNTDPAIFSADKRRYPCATITAPSPNKPCISTASVELYEFEYVDKKTDLTHKLTDAERDALYKVFQCRSKAMEVRNVNVDIVRLVAENTIKRRLNIL